MVLYTKAACWQPYMECSKVGSDQPLVVIIQTTFQKHMLSLGIACPLWMPQAATTSMATCCTHSGRV